MTKRSLETFAELRSIVDGDDNFMTGHQIRKKRNPERRIPEWTRRDKEVQKVLLRAFPKLATNQKHRNGAARWVRIIHMYFRMQNSRNQIAEELGVKVNVIRTLIRNIKWVAAGKRANGTGMLGNPRGRPKKRDTLVKTFDETEQAS